LRGEKNGRVYRLGDRVSVQVVRVDLERRQIDLGLEEILEAVRRRGGQWTGKRPDRPQRSVPDDRPAPRRDRGGRAAGAPKDRGRKGGRRPRGRRSR
jgi:ribonuclease R